LEVQNQGQGDRSLGAGARPRPRPRTLGPTGSAHGRLAHRQQGPRSPSFQDGSVPFTGRPIGWIRRSTATLRIGRAHRRSRSYLDFSLTGRQTESA